MKKLKQQFSNNLLTNPRHKTQPSNTISVDLLIEIFSLVPAKSIARFRCVSKFWASRLRLPDFSDLFTTKSLTRPRLFFTFEANGKLLIYSSPQPQNPDDNSTIVATPYFKSFHKYVPSDICTRVYGLVLIQGRKIKLPVICNPATGQFLTLPKVLPKEKEKISRMYFGYDPMGKQFKVLCMTSSPFKIDTQQVLTLESGKSFWRPVEYKSYSFEDHRIHGQICINGVLYFGATFGKSSIIVCFHVRSEKFVFIEADKDMVHGDCYFEDSLTLFNYKGKLGIHDLYSELLQDPQELVLWVLEEEDAGNHKWYKHIYALSPLGKKIVKESSFVGMTCTGEIVFEDILNPNFYVFFYNLETNTFTRVNIQGVEDFKDHDIILDTDYVENLKFM